jgi:hypothetical protein
MKENLEHALEHLKEEIELPHNFNILYWKPILAKKLGVEGDYHE